MNNEIKQILEAVSAGNMSVDEALLKVKRAPFEDIGYVTTVICAILNTTPRWETRSPLPMRTM